MSGIQNYGRACFPVNVRRAALALGERRLCAVTNGLFVLRLGNPALCVNPLRPGFHSLRCQCSGQSRWVRHARPVNGQPAGSLMLSLAGLVWPGVVALCSCAHLGSSGTINCSAQNYPIVPCPLEPSATVLDLSHNRIGRISRLDFSRASALRRLHLQFNQIGSIHREAFLLLRSLEYLDLSHNRLQDVSAVPLRSTPSLRHLDLRGNTYTELRLGAWLPRLPHLRVLRLGNDGVTSFIGARGQLPFMPRLKELYLVTGELRRYDRSLRGLCGLDQVTLELNTRGNLEAVKAVADDLLNATRALTLANVDAAGGGGAKPPVPALAGSGLRALTLRNVTTTERFCDAMLAELVRSGVEDLTVEGAVSSGRCVSRIPPFRRLRLTSFHVSHVDNPEAYVFLPEGPVVKFFQSFRRLSLVDARLFFVPCVVSQSMLRLTVLDVSHNALRLFSLFPGCVSAFPAVSSLTLDGNQLDSIVGLAQETLHMRRLATLSANRNRLCGEVGPARWTQSLRRLALRENGLSSAVISALPSTLEVLDLSANVITTLTGLDRMRGLAQLLLSHNKLLSLAGIPTCLPLSVLYVDHNSLRRVNGTLLASLGRALLKMGANPFRCDCQILGLSQHARSSSRVLDWPEGYRCQGPASLRGAELHSLRLPQCEISPALLSVLLLLVPVLVSLSLALRRVNLHWADRKIASSQNSPNGRSG